MTENKEEQINKYWKVEEVRPYIMNYLKEKFPESILVREFNDVDIMVLGSNIPVEIQRTITWKGIIDRKPKLSNFEDQIRRQIEQNIENNGVCWLFVDAEFVRYLHNSMTKAVSINMDWLYQFYKSEKLRVFSITPNGNIKELLDNDFSFITRFSSTCKINKDEDYRILQKNKSYIAYNVLKGCNFSTEEINNWYSEFEKLDKKGEKLKFGQWLNKFDDDRHKKLSRILQSLGFLEHINKLLRCEIEDHRALAPASSICLIEGNGKNNSSRIGFPDSYNISGYFPGYFARKELWDYLRTHTVGHKTFLSIIKGYDYMKDLRGQKNIDDAWE